MSQLSFFDNHQKPITLEKPVTTRPPKILVEVVHHCKHCKCENAIKAHEPIQTIDWMRQNWRETERNKFVTIGYCSRDCQEAAAQKK